MANTPLSDEAALEALCAVRDYKTSVAAAKALGLNRATLAARLTVAKQRGLRLDAKDDGIPKGLPFEREWATWMKEIGMARDRYCGPPKAKARTGRLRIAVLPDLHAPFHDRSAFAAFCEKEINADCVVVMGDIGDGYSLSRFLKYESVPYESELASVTAVLQALSEKFPIIRIIEGNHDGARLEKQLRERLSPDLVTAILSMTGGTLSPIHALCKRFPNIEFAPARAGRHAAGWMTQIGDALFCHAEKFSRVPGSALRAIEEWLADMEGTLDLKPWKVLVQAHTHQLSWIPWHADKLLIECGCLCQTHGYQVSAKIGGRPQRRGWVTLEQVDGKTDINSIRLVWWDAERKEAMTA